MATWVPAAASCSVRAAGRPPSRPAPRGRSPAGRSSAGSSGSCPRPCCRPARCRSRRSPGTWRPAGSGCGGRRSTSAACRRCRRTSRTGRRTPAVSPPSPWMTAAPYVFSPPMVAVAPPWLLRPSSAAAVPAAASAPAATSPDTSVAAARRAAPRPRADNAENEENTEFPFEQDPLTWGDGPTSRIRSPVSYVRHPRDAAHRASQSCRRITDPTRNRYRQDRP